MPTLPPTDDSMQVLSLYIVGYCPYVCTEASLRLVTVTVRV